MVMYVLTSQMSRVNCDRICYI